MLEVVWNHKIMPNSLEEPAEPSPNFPGYPAQEWTLVGGLKVRFAHAGTGPALVLVHGLLGYSFSWRQVIRPLAGKFEVFAPDLPGAGFSDCGSGHDCRLTSGAKRLLNFMDAVGISSCDLVGSSYGGTTALALAVLAPTRVRRLVLVSPANPWSRIGRARLALLRNPAAAAVFPTLARRMRLFQDYFLRRMWGDPRRITPETYRAYAAPLQRRGVLDHAVRIVRTWWEDMQELQATLPQIANVPTLLVWGSKDRTVDPASAEPMRRNFQSAQLAIIKGAGHLPYEECPEEFVRIVTDFLQSSPASTAPTGT
jgi:pimeloyl-ACP methyl ester carboxylesterase